MGNWFRGIAQNLISTALWVAGGAAVSAAVAIWVTYLTPTLRALAPASYFFGALIALLLFLIIAERGLRMWRQSHPTPLVASPKRRIDFSAETEARIAAVEEKNKVIIQDYQTVLGKLAQAEDNFAKHKEHIAAVNAAQDEARRTGLDSIKSDLVMLQRSCASVEETVTKNEKYVRESLYAIHAREQMADCALQIESDADKLWLRFKSGEVYTDREWDEWTVVHRHWERLLKRWMDLARWYAKDVKSRIVTIDDREYDADFGVRDNQFPTADANRRFKKHRIIQDHWESVREEADKGVELVAFSGQTEQEQHGGKFHQEETRL